MASYTGEELAVAESGPVAVESSETFEDFYEREFRAVVGLAYALSGSRSGAEDIAQEAFLVAHRDWDRVGTYDRPDVWVRRVVANLSVSVFRRRVVEAKALARIALGYTPSSARALGRRRRVLGRRPVASAPAGTGHRAPLPGRSTRRRGRSRPRHGRGHGQEAPVRRPEGARPPARARGGRRMTLDTRARRAAQGIHRAVEVMEMTTSTKEPRKVERFDRFRDRKQRNRRLGAILVAAALVITAVARLDERARPRTGNRPRGAVRAEGPDPLRGPR